MTDYEGEGFGFDTIMQNDMGSKPECFLMMKGQLIEYIPEKSLTVSFPVLDQYLNPAGSMQGGLITGAFDNVFGPLSHAVMKSLTATVDINTSYHRPIFVGDELIITATVRSRGKTLVHMVAEAYNKEGRLVASATTNYVYLKNSKIEEANL